MLPTAIRTFLGLSALPAALPAAWWAAAEALKRQAGGAGRPARIRGISSALAINQLEPATQPRSFKF